MKNRGFSQAELMITLALLSIGFLGAVAAFKGMAKGILVTKTKSLAVNLAQEKVEFLKNKSYYRLRISSSFATNYDPDPDVVYDPYNYPPESLNIGGIDFTRYAIVEKVRKSASSNSLETVSWNDPDTGLKRIKTIVIWREGAEWKQLNLQNLRENPSRGAANVKFNGVVKDTMNVAMANAVVEVSENPSWRDDTDAGGSYEFNIFPGTYTLRASKTGYFTAEQTGQAVNTTNSPVTVSFNLSRKSSGTVTGSVWIRDHLVISQVVGSTVSAAFDQEWVEIYNPTTWTWTASDVGLRFQREVGIDASPVNVDIVYVTTGIDPGKFYLFANTGTVYAAGVVVSADATWNLTPGTNDIAFSPRFSVADPNIITTFEDTNAWGRASVQLYRVSTSSAIDIVGWKGNGSQMPPIYEGNPMNMSQGLNDEEQFYRYSSTGDYNPAYGPAYDSGDNQADVKVLDPVGWVPKSSANAAVSSASGTPADGAYVFASDGLSNTVQASNTGTPPYASYTLSSIATGTWTLAASSGTLYYELSIAMTGGSQTQNISLTSTTDSGYVSGQVTAVGGGGLSGITVIPGNITTDGSGNYRLSVSPGSQSITANPGGTNPLYVQDSTNVTVTAGQIVSGINFQLSGGGKIRGRITSDGTNALPDVPVSILNSGGTEVANVLSQSDGYFEATASTGDYSVDPVEEFGEVVSPSTAAVTVTSGGTVFSSTFTIGPAHGTVTGKVTLNGENITTGVLLIASTGTVANPPPNIDASLRSGGQVYYLGSSTGDGSFSLNVREGTFNLYGWYTTFSGSTPSTTMKSKTGISVTAGNTTSGQDLSWP